MLLMGAGSCNLQVSALCSLTLGSPSAVHYTAIPELLSKAWSISHLCALSSFAVFIASAPRCCCRVQGRGGAEAVKYELQSVVPDVQGSKVCLDGKRRTKRFPYLFI